MEGQRDFWRVVKGVDGPQEVNPRVQQGAEGVSILYKSVGAGAEGGGGFGGGTEMGACMI